MNTIVSLNPVENSIVYSGDSITITFSNNVVPASVSSSSFILSYTNYTISLPYDVNIDPEDGSKVIVTIGETHHITDRIKLVVVGGEYGVKFEDGEDLDEYYYAFYFNLGEASDSGDTDDGGDEHPDESHRSLEVIDTDPVDNKSNFRGNEVQLTFNTEPLDDPSDPISGHVFVYLSPVLEFDDYIDIPDEGFLDTSAYDVALNGVVLTVSFHDDAIPHNAVVNIIVEEGLKALDSSYLSLQEQFELVFSMNFSPAPFSASVFSTIITGVPDELFYRAQLISVGIAEALWTCGNINWSNPLWCVKMFVFENTKDIIMKRFAGVVGYLGGSFSKRLGDLSISYASPRGDQRDDTLDGLYPLVANCCEKAGISGGVIGELNEYPIPYYNKETAGRRFPLLREYIIVPKHIVGEDSPFYGIIVHKKMSISEHVE